MAYLTHRDALSFLRDKKNLVVEIGFGNGAFLRWLSEVEGGWVVGVDVANLAFEKAFSRVQGKDVVLVKADGFFFLKYLVKPGTLSKVFVLFPDPWPKNKKRRLVNERFIRLVSSRLSRGGELFMATDDLDYARQMEEVASVVMEVYPWRLPVGTKYQKKWESMGRGYTGFRCVNVKPEDVGYEEPVKDFVLEHAVSSGAGVLAREQEAVVKLDAVFCREDARLLRFIYSEGGFSERYMVMEKGGMLFSVNVWGEVYPRTFLRLLARF